MVLAAVNQFSDKENKGARKGQNITNDIDQKEESASVEARSSLLMVETFRQNENQKKNKKRKAVRESTTRATVNNYLKRVAAGQSVSQKVGKKER